MNCPTCKKPFADSDAKPFCSDRCRLIDLGNWLGGKYRIAGEPANDRPPRDDPETEN